MSEITDTKPEFYNESRTIAVYSNEQALMNDPVATMNDLVVTMGGVDTFNQYTKPELTVDIENTKP